MGLTWQQSMGLEESHLTEFSLSREQSILVHLEVVEPLRLLLQKAEQAKVSISVISGFRSFTRQLAIWNDKWQGHKPVYSRQGRPLNILNMSPIERFKAISLWSALPGLSRHHWGTDFDIFASQAILQGHTVELNPQEFNQTGPCGELNQWLDEELENLGFFRPYRRFQQGVAEEPWHISHQATSTQIFDSFDQNACRHYLAQSSIKASSFIGEQFDDYFRRYFANICPPIYT